jgi:DivIVA domain-containing protein
VEARFDTVVRGYDPRQVDELLDQAEQALASDRWYVRKAVLHALRSASFRRRLSGYDQDQVDRHSGTHPTAGLRPAGQLGGDRTAILSAGDRVVPAMRAAARPTVIFFAAATTSTPPQHDRPTSGYARLITPVEGRCDDQDAAGGTVLVRAHPAPALAGIARRCRAVTRSSTPASQC